MSLRPPPTSVLLRRCVTCAKYAACATLVASMTSAWYHRPIADYNDYEENEDNDGRDGGRRTGDDVRPPSSPPSSVLHRYASPSSSSPSSSTSSSSSSWSRERVPLLLDVARRISIGITTIAIRILMTTYGEYDIVDDENYRKFLKTVLGLGGTNIGGMMMEEEEMVGVGEGGNDDDDDDGRRHERRRHRHRRGLITVSNHRSLFDDPGVVSCLLPLPIAIQPKYNRWAICSQEYCFNDALPGLIKGYIGAGQVLPIRRGGGIDQRQLHDFGRHLARGEWCHVFPEGGVWQWNELGGRRELPSNAISVSSSDFGRGGGNDGVGGDVDGKVNDDDDDGAIRIIPATARQRSLPPSPIGKLKWGVGKLIAHAPITPVVMPFAHVGMERLLPQDEYTGKTRFRENALRSLLPTFLGGDDTDRLRVKVRFGEEVHFDDLIRDHETRYGRLWKYHGEDIDEYDIDDDRSRRESWRSSEEERVLYGKIVRRIEGRLDALTRDVCREEGVY